jgi:hypothetical protein
VKDMILRDIAARGKEAKLASFEQVRLKFLRLCPIVLDIVLFLRYMHNIQAINF